MGCVGALILLRALPELTSCVDSCQGASGAKASNRAMPGLKVLRAPLSLRHLGDSSVDGTTRELVKPPAIPTVSEKMET